MKILQKILFTLACGVSLFSFTSFVSAYLNAPGYDDKFASYMTSELADAEWNVDNVYNVDQVSADKSIDQNIRCLFYPNAENVCGSVRWWLIWSVVRYIWLWIFVLFLCVIGAKFVVKPDGYKEHLMSLLYVFYWSVLFFWSTWILWTALNVYNLTWTASLVDAVQWNSDSLWFKIVAFFKALVFFFAIVMIVVYSFKVMACADKQDKAQTAIKWIINVVVALVVIKVVDYLYFIAQASDFVDQATSFIIEVAKILWYIVWALLVLMAFYAWFLFITDQWKGENMKKATKIIVWIVLVSSVIFLLLLIMYQLFMDFSH